MTAKGRFTAALYTILFIRNPSNGRIFFPPAKTVREKDNIYDDG
jgi:hypothetical protein